MYTSDSDSSIILFSHQYRDRCTARGRGKYRVSPYTVATCYRARTWSAHTLWQHVTEPVLGQPIHCGNMLQSPYLVSTYTVAVDMLQSPYLVSPYTVATCYRARTLSAHTLWQHVTARTWSAHTLWQHVTEPVLGQPIHIHCGTVATCYRANMYLVSTYTVAVDMLQSPYLVSPYTVATCYRARTWSAHTLWQHVTEPVLGQPIHCGNMLQSPYLDAPNGWSTPEGQ